jgi:hypothetical protein
MRVAADFNNVMAFLPLSMISFKFVVGTTSEGFSGNF